MAVEPLRFRCYQCGKLLGVSPSKAGRVVACPTCAAELIVPEPESEPVTGGETGAFSGIVTTEPTPSAKTDEFVRPTSLPTSETPTSVLAGPTPSRPTFPLEPDSDVERIKAAPLLGFLETAREAVPTIDVGKPEPIREGPPSRSRGRDVVLPSGVVAAWSILVLLAVVSAFVAGLLIGHFVWKR